MRELICTIIALFCVITLAKEGAIPTPDKRPEDEIIITHPTEEETTEEETTEEATTQAQLESVYVYSFTDAEKDLMARVAYWECGNHGWEAMALVCNVIINRANLYGASVTEIIYSPNQFQVLDYIYTREPSPEAYTAVEAVMQGWDASQGALYFCSPAHNGWHSSHLTYLFTYGGTEWYR